MSLRRIQKGSPEEILIDREKEPPSMKGGSLLSVVQHLLNCCADNRFITVVQSHILTKKNIDACPFHTRLVRNLLTVCAHRNLQLSQRIQHTSSKSIRGRLMSYFSECAKRARSNSFLIPYNRQQLADYLNVDRSTMCNELSKMQKDGIIEYSKNQFLLKDSLMFQ